MRQILVSLLITLCLGFTASAQNSVPTKKYFAKVSQLKAWVNQNGEGHNARVYACKTNEAGEMCMKGRAMTIDEAYNFFDELPTNSGFCGGCYLVFEKPQISQPPPPEQPQVEEEEPAPRRRGSSAWACIGDFVARIFANVNVNIDAGGGQTYVEPVEYERPIRASYQVASFREEYCPPRSRYGYRSQRYCPPRPRYCPPTRYAQRPQTRYQERRPTHYTPRPQHREPIYAQRRNGGNRNVSLVNVSNKATIKKSPSRSGNQASYRVASQKHPGQMTYR